MTTVANKAWRSVSVPAPLRHRLVLAWAISPAAVKRAGLARSCEQAHLEIETPLPGESGFLMPRLVIDGCAQEINPYTDPHTDPHISAATWTSDDALFHLDLPGIIHATAQIAPAAMRVLYARTGLLADLGIGGGRYEFIGAEVR